MDNEKIRIFIKKLRNEKSMTQKQLAELLNITDKAISKWETGRGIPDISMLEPLSKAFEVSLNELMNGERINIEQVSSKSNEAIKNTLDYSHKEIKRCKKNTLIFGIAAFLLVLSFLFLGDDSSWKCVYSVAALIVLCIGIFRTCDKKRIIIALAAFVVGISLFQLMDINNIVNFNKPPIYVLSITTEDKTIIYKSLFYNVYRYNTDMDNEYYRIHCFFNYTDYPVLSTIQYNK